MNEWSAFFGLVAFMTFMIATPGPANLLLMAAGARSGVKANLGFVLGLIGGKIGLNIALGLGVGLLLQGSPISLGIMKGISVAWMSWLALKAWRLASPQNATTQHTFSFWQGVGVHPLNPKAWAMLSLAWSQYAPAFEGVGLQIAVVGGTSAAVQAVLHLFWLGLGRFLGTYFNTSILFQRTLAILTLVVVGIAVWF